MTPSKLNAFLLVKLPSAWLCGVRVKKLSNTECEVGVRHRWINQNPFKSMFWAVQGMAAELSTGSLVMSQIQQSGKRVSMLVTQNKASFSKKATGKISFICKDGKLIQGALEKAIATGDGQTIWMESVGTNADGVEVSRFSFQWSIKVKA